MSDKPKSPTRSFSSSFKQAAMVRLEAGKFHLDPGTRGIGVDMPGAFADYVKVPAFDIVPLPDEIDDEFGAILDPLGHAVHTASPRPTISKASRS